jgi:hypothetical protein
MLSLQPEKKPICTYFCSSVILGWSDHDQLSGIHSSALKERVERNNPTRLDVYTMWGDPYPRLRDLCREADL